MKKIKKILSLVAASLVMGGLILNSSINTTTASAEEIRYKYNEKFRNEPQIRIQGSYSQRLCFKTRAPQTSNKPYWSSLFEVKDGLLKVRSMGAAMRNYFMDDQYAFLVLNKNGNVRFKFLFSYNPKPQINDEFNDFIDALNAIEIGVDNYLVALGKYWNGTVLWDTTKPYTALIRNGYNRFEKGFTDNEHKYNTLLKVTNDGLKEVTSYWGDDRVFKAWW